LENRLTRTLITHKTGIVFKEDDNDWMNGFTTQRSTRKRQNRMKKVVINFSFEKCEMKQ